MLGSMTRKVAVNRRGWRDCLPGSKLVVMVIYLLVDLIYKVIGVEQQHRIVHLMASKNASYSPSHFTS